MTRLLVSVRDAREARAAIEGGADLIDVKEPSRGALGAASPRVWSEIASEITGEKPMSVALGELNSGNALSMAPQAVNVQFAKLGLAGCRRCAHWKTAWSRVVARLPAGTSSVAVAYADCAEAFSPPPMAILQEAIHVGCEAILFDTFEKRNGDLFDHLNIEELGTYSKFAREHGMQVVLAGSLTEQSIPNAVSLKPDFVAVRGAACDGNRTQRISVERTQRIAEVVRQSIADCREVA